MFRAEHNKVVAKQKVNSLFFSVSDTFKFLAGTCTAIGMALVVPALPSWIGGVEVAAATMTAATTGLWIVGAAALCTAIAVGSSYVASRYFCSATLDATELNAQHNAKYIVQELKKEAACVQHEGNCRADGKEWREVVKPQSQPQIAASV